MRESGLDHQLSALDLEDQSGHSIVHSLCQEWLLRIEMNMVDSEITFEAIQWAISKLQGMEEQTWYNDYRSQDEDTGGTIHLARWRSLLSDAGGGAFERLQGSSRGDRRGRDSRFVFSSALKEAVMAAEEGEAGRRMIELINSRLDVSDCVSLTKLVSHCLLVSLDQTPTSDISASLPSYPGNYSSTAAEEDWMWLHRWFIGSLLPSGHNDSYYSSLDWLLAYMTAARGTITKLVLHYLMVDLQNLSHDDQPPVATYIRRTGILEYAALKWD